ncbi:MAG: hypothetical protein HYU48_01045 [Candidatus Levybacteria bacterium]|nr:hypothetical protein [Candidatus Levybacteria bacterium]
MPKKSSRGRSASGRKASKKTFSRRLPFVLGLISSLILSAILGYSVFQFQNSEQEEEGFLACDKEGKVCELAQHIHADIGVSICGENINFSKEKGGSGQHTHKELNKIHWEARIKVDKETRKPLDPTPMMLKSFFEEMEQEIPQSCNGEKAVTTVAVNGVKTELGLNYVWADGDIIEVVVE